MYVGVRTTEQIIKFSFFFHYFYECEFTAEEEDDYFIVHIGHYFIKSLYKSSAWCVFGEEGDTMVISSFLAWPDLLY